MTGGRLKGAELHAKVICEDGETVFATLSKERTQGRIEITREPPSQLPRHTVLLFYGHRVGRRSLDGEWLLPTDSPAR